MPKLIKKDKVEKWPILTKTMDYPFEISIFWLFELLVLYCLERRFFLLDYSQRHFTGLNCLEIKQWKNRQFLIKTMDEPLWKNLNCSTLWTSSLYSLQKRVLVLEYRKIPFRWNTFGKISIFRLFELRVFIA